MHQCSEKRIGAIPVIDYVCQFPSIVIEELEQFLSIVIEELEQSAICTTREYRIVGIKI